MRLELKALADGVAEIVKTYVETAREALSARLDSIERRFNELPMPKDGAPGKDGSNGLNAEPVDADAIIASVLSQIPIPVDGKDGVNGANGEAGKDAAPIDTDSVIAAVLAQVPRPDNGKDGMPGKDGLPGRDGTSFTADEAKALLEPEIAKWALDFERRAQDTLQKTIDRLPKPKDGVDGVHGKDGADAIGFDDLTVEHDGDRGFKIKFISGERVKEFTFTIPVVLDRGYYREGDAFEKGDGVTFGGSYWIAQSLTRTKPEIGNEDWRLAVKKGRDAKTPAMLEPTK